MFARLVTAAFLAATFTTVDHHVIAQTANVPSRVFRYAAQQDVATLDPYVVDETFTTSFLANIYEPLVRRGRKLEIEPALAERWEQVEPTRWLFHLRRNARFQDGTPFTADDVVFSLGRVREDGSNMVARVTTIVDSEAVDPATVAITTTLPDPTLLANLTAVLIMPRSWAEAHGAAHPAKLTGAGENYATMHANGTGPFRVESRQPAGNTVLEVNQDWWDKPEHNLDGVSFTPILNPATRLAALLSGAVDFIDPVPIQNEPEVSASDKAVLLAAPELRTVFLGMDQVRPELLYSSVKGRNPLADLRVRRAFFQAIDIEAIRTRIMRGQAQPTAELSGPGIVGFDSALNTRLPFDVDNAKHLMTEAGYRDGFDLTMHCPSGRYVNDAAICQAVAAMLARIDVRVRVATEAPALFFGRAARRDVSFYMLGTTPPTYDSFSTVYGLLMCRVDQLGGRPASIANQGAFNHGGFCDPELDRLATDAQSQLDAGIRQNDFSRMWKIMQEQVGYIPLHQQALAWGVRKGVSVVQRPDGVLDLRFVRLP